ncbi:general stress protein [Neobacillus dielmonensis]|uniref:general stress protein n=1 Tax=Neobacillus dielmonensis TaxID=1347369 RepID=UPI0005AA56B6|nr:general stress protein [Neobacillus dielmonensis]
MAYVKVVENGVAARKEIEQFIIQGYTKEEIYLLAHDEKRSEDLSDSLEINNIGVAEQGVLDSLANVFRSRGEELRSKLQSLGIPSGEAELYEEQLDRGKVVVVAAKSA